MIAFRKPNCSVIVPINLWDQLGTQVFLTIYYSSWCQWTNGTLIQTPGILKTFVYIKCIFKSTNMYEILVVKINSQNIEINVGDSSFSPLCPDLLLKIVYFLQRGQDKLLKNKTLFRLLSCKLVQNIHIVYDTVARSA